MTNPFNLLTVEYHVAKRDLHMLGNMQARYDQLHVLMLDPTTRSEEVEDELRRMISRIKSRKYRRKAVRDRLRP